MADALNLDKFRRVPFVRSDLTLTREAADELQLVTLRTGGVLGVIPAAAIKFVPVGGLTAADVQAALQELDAEKEAEGTAFLLLADHVADPDPHTQYALDADLAGMVPDTRTINGHALSADVTVTAADVGLGSVDNTSDLAKPVSTATATALAAKLDTTAAPELIRDTIGAALVAGANVTVTVNDAGDTITIAATGGGGGSGDVVGPGSAVDSNVALFDGATGKLLKDGGFGLGKRRLADVTLGSAGALLSSGSFAAYEMLEVHVFLAGMASADTPSLQFNGGGGATAYRYKWGHMNAAASTFTNGNIAVSTDRVKIGSNDKTGSRRVTVEISNDAAITEKLLTFSSAVGTGSAASQGQIDLGTGAWVSAAATQITQVDLISTANMTAGTRLVVFGW